jgi:hypothetical protein
MRQSGGCVHPIGPEQPNARVFFKRRKLPQWREVAAPDNANTLCLRRRALGNPAWEEDLCKLLSYPL